MDKFLSFRNVTKSFQVNEQEQIILNDASFVFPNTGLVSIYGKSGSGKTTILNLIGLLEKPNKGEILFRGQKISNLKRKERTKFRQNKVSYVFQNYNLVDELTLLENIKIHLSIKNADYDEQTIKTKVNDFKMAHLLDAKVATLSGGEKQRTCLICAVLNHSEIILLDEPTGALDQENAALIMDDIKMISKSCLVIMVSHNHELIESYSDFIFELDKGKLNCQKTTEKSNSMEFCPKSPTKKSSFSWFFLLFNRSNKKNRWSNLLTLLVSVFSFTSLFVALSFSLSGDHVMSQALFEHVDGTVLNISKKEKREINGSFITLTRNIRPEESEVEQVINTNPNIIFDYDFNGLFGDVVDFNYAGKTNTGVNFKPYYDFDRNANYNEVIINTKLAEEIGFKNKDQFLRIDILKTVNNLNPENNKEIIDFFIFDEKLIIQEVKEEFHYLEIATIYYPYFAFKDYLENYLLESYSNFLETPYSFYDLISDSKASSSLGNYRYKMFFKNQNDVTNFYLNQTVLETNKGVLSVDSNNFLIRLSLESFFKSISIGLIFFLALLIFACFSIIGIVTYANYMKSEKELFHYFVLGKPMGQLNIVFYIQKLFVGVISLALSAIFARLLINPVNQVIYKMSMIYHFIAPPSSQLNLLMIIISLLSLFILILSIAIPLLFRQEKRANLLLRLKSS